MRILHIIPSLSTGGAERLVSDLVMNFDYSLHDIHLIILSNQKNTSFENQIINNPNIHSYFLNKKRGFRISTILKLKKLIKNINPDVINTHLNSLPYVAYATKFSKQKIKFFHTFHLIASEEAHGVLKFIYKRIFKQNKFAAIGISDIVSNSIKETYNIKTIFTIYNGINYNRFYNPKSLLEREYDFILVARLAYMKNHDMLIDAMNIVHQSLKNSKLILLGDGELRQELINKVESLNLNQNVIFMGNISNVETFLQNSKIFVMTSHWEGNPLSLMEACAAGCLIISTDAGGVKDIIKNEINGFIVEKNPQSIANQMLFAINNLKAMQKIAIAGQQAIKEYDIANVCNNYCIAYSKFEK